MKGIILAGGAGTRLHPLTKVVSKQLLPVYDKPMIYYPLSTLMLAGITEILIIATKNNLEEYKKLFGDGVDLGLTISYVVQVEPKGIADAFLIGEEFIGDSSVCLILGDNILYGNRITHILNKGFLLEKGALIYGYYVNNPSEFGVIEFDESGNVLSIEEKPKNPKSNYAIPGVYFYDNKVIEYAKKIKPSDRGELEIRDINKQYLASGSLKVEVLGRGMAWLDTGTYEGLLEATNFIHTIQKRAGLYIACLEEIAYKKGYINKIKLMELAEKLEKTDYGQYLKRIAKNSK